MISRRTIPNELCEPATTVDELARIVVDAAVEVHKTLGPGFAESVYEHALAVELSLRRVPFQRQVPVSVRYKGVEVGEGRVDMLVGGSVVVELKAVETLASVHLAQILSYLRATRCSLGLLITFNVRLLREGIKRVVVTP